LATRFYFPSTGTADISPAFDAEWNDSSSVTRRPLNRLRGTSAFLEVSDTETSALNTWDILLGQFVSAPLQAQTLTGTFSCVIRARESAAGVNARSQMVVKVVSNDGTTVRGTLFPADTTTTNVNEWVVTTTATAARNAFFPKGTASQGFTSLAIQANDRLVVEVGARTVNTATTAGFTAAMRFGEAAASDLTADETGVVEGNPWIEFSSTLLFQADLPTGALNRKPLPPLPPARYEVDWRNPLTRGLVFFAIPNQRAGPELVGGAKPTVFGNAPLATGIQGVGFSTADDISGWAYDARPDKLRSIGTGFTVACKVDVVAAQWSKLVSIPYLNSTVWDYPWAALNLGASGDANATCATLEMYDGSAVPSALFPPGTVVAGAGQSYIATRTGTTISLRVDGQTYSPLTNPFSATAVVFGDSNAVVLLNRSALSPGEGSQGLLYFTAIWNRALNSAECAAIENNPFQILRRPRTVRQTSTRVPRTIPAITATSPLRLPSLRHDGAGTPSSGSTDFTTDFSSDFARQALGSSTGTSAATLAPLRTSAAGTRTIPARTGTSATRLPLPAHTGDISLSSPVEFSNEFSFEFTAASSALSASSDVTLPKLATAASANRSIPDRTAASAVILPRLATATTATRLIPARTAASAVITPKLSATATATRTVPARTATSAVTLPKLSTTATGSRTLAGLNATSAVATPRLSANASGTRTVPTRTAASAVTLPKLTHVAAGSRTLSGIAASSAIILPKTSTAASGSRTLPTRTATGAITVPKLTGTASGTRLIPDRTATSPVRLSKPVVLAQGTVSLPNTVTGTASLRFRSLTLAASGTRAIPSRTASSTVSWTRLRHLAATSFFVPGAIPVVAHFVAPPWRTADFGDGSVPVVWASPLDPGERKAYSVDCTRELGSTNIIEVLDVAPSGLALLAGLQVSGMSHSTSLITVWMEINPADRTRLNWNGAGETHYLTFTINVSDGQRFQRDAALTIRQLGQT
jgi:microcompartment protein CcmK/EutM